MFSRTRAYIAALAALLAGTPNLPVAISGKRVKLPGQQAHKQRRRRTNGANHFRWKSGQGPQECARRVRQMRQGQLTASNGLLVPGYRYLGHGRSEKVSVA